jgi:hypothetical protein
MQPTWTVLVVAFLGVAGTLGAAIFTQFWSARREDRRWRQEQLADDQRWQRQQQERRELWQREDQLRLAQQRQDAYAEFLLAVAKWASAANSVVLDRREHARTPTDEELSRLAVLVEHAEAACVPVRLHGSQVAADASDEVCRVMLSSVRVITEKPLDSDMLDQALAEFRRTSEEALTRVRTDLGIS